MDIAHLAELCSDDEDVPEKCPNVHRTSPYIWRGTSLGRAQDVNLTITLKIVFYEIFSIFPDSNCISDNTLSK